MDLGVEEWGYWWLGGELAMGKVVEKRGGVVKGS